MMSILVALSSLLALVSYVVYVIAILNGQAKPHRTTRFVVAIITILSTVALVAKGSSVAVWLSGVFMVGSVVIFLLSLRFGMGGWEKTDLVCLAIAIGGIIFWQSTTDPLYALYASIIADCIGQIPMLVKTYRQPETEAWTFYFLDVIAACFSIMAIQRWSVQETLYPLYIVFIDGTTIFFILRKPIAAFIASQ